LLAATAAQSHPAGSHYTPGSPAIRNNHNNKIKIRNKNKKIKIYDRNLLGY
jgi:hypothetical protein